MDFEQNPYEVEPIEQPQPRAVTTPKRRRSGWLTGVLIVLLLAVGVMSTVRFLREWNVSFVRTDDGITISAGKQKPQPQQPQAVSEQPIAPQQPQVMRPKHIDTGAALQIAPPRRGVDTPSAESAEALSLQDIYTKMIPSVVSIATDRGSGTGIVMTEDGYIITNHHVIENARSVSVLTSSDETYAARLVGSDEASDLAVLFIEPTRPLAAAEFGDSSALRVGDTVVAIGDPLGLELRGTMTNGIISAINRDMLVSDRKLTLIQTNAALNSGNSGGPLINCYGQVIGINTMKLSSYRAQASVEGLGFAIPISSVKPIVDELIEKGYVSGRPAIGISGEQLPGAVRAYYRLPDGVYITYVSPVSDAYAKGIAPGDIVTAINGESVSDVDDLNAVKNQFAAGDTVTLTVFTRGQYFDVEITLVDEALQ